MGQGEAVSRSGDDVALLSRTFQIDLRKFCSGWEGLKLQQIDDMFQGAGIELGPETAARSGGDRQKLAQRYLSTINWDSEEDVEKVLQAVTIALFGESTSPEHKAKLRALCEKEGLRIEEEQVVLAADKLPTKKTLPIRRRSRVAEFDVFVSWSQPSSRHAAEAFREWLPKALPGINAWMSKADITKGRPWFTEVSEQLSRSKACLICITTENVKSPWLFYEAGAVAHAMPGALICSYLIGVTPSSLAGTPLAEFQATIFDKEDTRRLIRDLNRQLDSPHDEALLRSAFDKNWTSLLKKLSKIVSAMNAPDRPDNANDPHLSSAEMHILTEAAKDRRGIITMTRNLDAFELRAHGMQLVDGNTPRLEAIYREAMKNLINLGLLEPRGDDGESFALTQRGWTTADKLAKKAAK